MADDEVGAGMSIIFYDWNRASVTADLGILRSIVG